MHVRKFAINKMKFSFQKHYQEHNFQTNPSWLLIFFNQSINAYFNHLSTERAEAFFHPPFYPDTLQVKYVRKTIRELNLNYFSQK